MALSKNYQTRRRTVSAAQWRPEHPGPVAALLAENGMTYRPCAMYKHLDRGHIEIGDPASGFTHGGIAPGTWLVEDGGELQVYGPDEFIEKFEMRMLRGGT